MIRTPLAHECAALTALCHRSKAHWGYDAAFMAACRDELTLRPRDLAAAPAAVIGPEGAVEAVAQVSIDGEAAHLEKLFVDPPAMGRGHGRRLLAWAADAARRAGARTLWIEADPDAEPFYRRFGAIPDGTVPSGSIPGRRLPRLRLPL